MSQQGLPSEIRGVLALSYSLALLGLLLCYMKRLGDTSQVFWVFLMFFFDVCVGGGV